MTDMPVSPKQSISLAAVVRASAGITAGPAAKLYTRCIVCLLVVAIVLPLLFTIIQANPDNASGFGKNVR